MGRWNGSVLLSDALETKLDGSALGTWDNVVRTWGLRGCSGAAAEEGALETTPGSLVLS